MVVPELVPEVVALNVAVELGVLVAVVVIVVSLQPANSCSWNSSMAAFSPVTPDPSSEMSLSRPVGLHPNSSSDSSDIRRYRWTAIDNPCATSVQPRSELSATTSS